MTQLQPIRGHLLAAEVGVVGGVAVVLAQRLVHVLVHVQPAVGCKYVRDFEYKNILDFQKIIQHNLSRSTGALSSDMRYLMKPSLLILSSLTFSGSGSNMVMISMTLFLLYSG